MRGWQDLHSRDRRALVTGGIVMGSALCFSLVIRPLLHERAALSDQLREQRGLLAREYGVIASAERASANRDVAAAALVSVGGRLFPDRDPLAATAALANAVSSAARQEGVLLESIEARQPEAVRGTVLAVRVDVRGRGDLEGLLRWVASIENSRQLLRIEQLGVARTSVGGRLGSADVEVLSLAATVRGFLLAAGPDVAGSATVLTGWERRQ